MHSTRVFYIQLKVPLELYKELQLCPNMTLTRSPSSGAIRLIPDTTSSQKLNTTNAKESDSSEPGAFAPISNMCVPQPDHSNSVLLSSLQNRNPVIADTVKAISTNVTQPFYITYPALSNGKTIVPLVKNIPPSLIYLPPVPNNRKLVLRDGETLVEVGTNIGQSKTTLAAKTVLDECDANRAITTTSDFKISNESDTDFLPVAEIVLNKDKASVVNKVARNLEINETSDKGFLPTTESVSGDSKESRDNQVVVSNEEVNKSDKRFLPTTESVSSDVKESWDNQVISNEETNKESVCDTGLFFTAGSVLNDSGHSDIKEVGTNDGHLNIKPPTSLANSIVINSPTTLIQESSSIGTFEKDKYLKISPGLGCNPSNSITSSKSTANLMPGKLIVNRQPFPKPPKIKYPRECEKCLRKYSSRGTFSQHKKRCCQPVEEVSVRRPINPLTFEQACIHWKIKYPPDTIRNSQRVPENPLRVPIPTPINFKDKKWVHFSSGKVAYYVKSASLKE